jgi:hypothetical protein
MTSARPQNGVLALTCDTLLSSQGAGAHLCEAFGLVLGQRSQLTDFRRGSQNAVTSVLNPGLVPPSSRRTGLAWRTLSETQSPAEKCGLVSVTPLRCRNHTPRPPRGSNPVRHRLAARDQHPRAASCCRSKPMRGNDNWPLGEGQDVTTRTPAKAFFPRRSTSHSP